MIMAGLTEAPNANPDSMLSEMCGRMGKTCISADCIDMSTSVRALNSYFILLTVWNLCPTHVHIL